MRSFKFISILMIVTISLVILDISTANASDNNEIKIVLNGSPLQFDVKPYIKNGRTLVPFRKLFESLGITQIYWDDYEKTISARDKSTDVYLKIGQTTAIISGYEIALDVAPEITDGRTFVPLRFVSENLGAEIKWDQDTKTIYINHKNKEYKSGQVGEYSNLKFSIDTVRSRDGVIKVFGRINAPDKNLVVVVSDDYGDFIASNFNIFDKENDMYNMEANVYMPSCHQIEPKNYTIKILENDSLTNIGTYTF